MVQKQLGQQAEVLGILLT
jgi:hypothetical protein